MRGKYRLQSSRYDREQEENRISPYRIYYVSTEGSVTEKEYFEGLSANREALGIHAVVDVEVLRRSPKDGHSAPQHVIELLEEYVQLRREGIYSELKDPFFDPIVSEYGMDFIRQYLENPKILPSSRKNQLVTRLLEIGYDINYRKYLIRTGNTDTTSTGSDDVFCILIDRDAGSHTAEEMRSCMEYCHQRNYQCFIANPCFEFWLLLHLSDVKVEYADKLDEILKNEKDSNKHTYVSRILSEKAHHGKRGIHFKTTYLPHVMDAVVHAKEFDASEEDLIDHLGCNLWQLIEDMKEYSGRRK